MTTTLKRELPPLPAADGDTGYDWIHALRGTEWWVVAFLAFTLDPWGPQCSPESYYWCGDGTSRTHTPPEPGTLIAHEHAVWRVIEIIGLPREKWTERELEDWLHGHSSTPMVVVLRPVRITSTDVRARDHDMPYRWPRALTCNPGPNARRNEPLS